MSAVTNYPAKAAESYTTFPFLGRKTASLFLPGDEKLRNGNVLPLNL
jgi:hypothetical protein